MLSYRQILVALFTVIGALVMGTAAAVGVNSGPLQTFQFIANLAASPSAVACASPVPGASGGSADAKPCANGRDVGARWAGSTPGPSERGSAPPVFRSPTPRFAGTPAASP